MNQPSSNPKARSMQWWQSVARRIRVPLGFLTAAFYLFEVVRHAPQPAAIAWSLALVVPGLALRAVASGTVKKNSELTVTGPYAYTRNPLYLGSALIVAGFVVALLNWQLALLVGCGFVLIYAPVIASEERFLRATFSEFDEYCRRVPRLIPRITPAKLDQEKQLSSGSHTGTQVTDGGFSLSLYRKHREYNAALGAALLYLSLLYLRPVLEIILRLAR
jgi:protein-S-isoprenylcysteine O-methyltransferase Ste14